MIYNLFHKLVVNMGKYLLKKGKVRENKSLSWPAQKSNPRHRVFQVQRSTNWAVEVDKALYDKFAYVLIFADLSLFRQIFPHINHKQMNKTLFVSVYLLSLPFAHLSDAPRRRLVITRDSARIQDATTQPGSLTCSVYSTVTRYFGFKSHPKDN